jgi:hypothetical protein
MIAANMMMIWTTIFALLVVDVMATSKICALDRKRVALLAREEDSGKVYVVDQWTPGNETLGAGGGIRRRRSLSDQHHRNTHHASDEFLFYARECNCFEQQRQDDDPVFCPLAVSTCQQLSSGSILCVLDDPKENQNVKAAFWFAMICLFLLLSSVLCCSFGRNMLDHLIASMFPSWNVFVMDRIIGRNPERYELAERVVSVHRHRRQEPATSRNTSAAPSSKERSPFLLLKTQTYSGNNEAGINKETTTDDFSTSSDDSSVDSDDHCDSCAICLVPMQVGDRVGALSCNHIFRTCTQFLMSYTQSRRLTQLTSCFLWLIHRRHLPQGLDTTTKCLPLMSGRSGYSFFLSSKIGIQFFF